MPVRRKARTRTSTWVREGNFGCCVVSPPKKISKRCAMRTAAPSSMSGPMGPRRVALPQAGELGPHILGHGGDLGGFVAQGAQHVLEDGAERRRLAGALLLRKIGAGEERDLLRREERVERPAAGMAHDIGGRLVALVDVGTLFAVDQDADEILVEEARDLRIAEALLRHHRAPMAGAVADGEEDGLVLRRATANASGPQGYQSTGLSLWASR